ncbi:hypothetical protein ACFVOR_36685 [Streptomyces sp. NPDC057837]|uniref:hypothetical protein n=1 Tax=Streptomyces sp. NPDC057837 TaxID=3346260 RepID=UPI0036A82FC5
MTLLGEIDHDAQGVLRRSPLGVDEVMPARIVADLNAVTFMDSAGANVFIAAHLQQGGCVWPAPSEPSGACRR